jgi:aspartyl/asparaginyl beta-hydroxylase (cupin superfamily)
VTSEPIYYRTDAPYAGNAPYFYAVDRLPWARRLTESWRTILAEYEDNVGRGTDDLVDVFNPTGPKIAGWRSVNFQTYLWRRARACRTFPRTVALLDAVPGLTSAFINVLEPGASIPAHHGDSNAIIRCHLGLRVPDGDCAVRVGPETRRCADGALLAFCDAHEHASWNATDERRVVLVFDVMRPEHLARTRWICANVLAATAVIWLEARLGASRRRLPFEVLQSGKTVPLPSLIRTPLRRALALPLYLALPHRGRVPDAAPLREGAVGLEGSSSLR